MNADVQKLKDEAKQFDDDVQALANALLDDPQFAIWPASIDKHQSFEGGLACHTREMWDLANSTTDTLDITVERDVVFLAILYHDIGKLSDYKKDANGKWVKSDHCRNIHHISRSGIIWSMAAEARDISYEYQDKVLHCILAHHGRREWGSPVAPKSREAWLVHTVDMMSARMDDWHKLDIVKHEK